MKRRLLATYVICALVLLLLPAPTGAAGVSAVGTGEKAAFAGQVDDGLSLFATDEVATSFQFLASSSSGEDKAPLSFLFAAQKSARQHVRLGFSLRARSMRAGLSKQCFCFGTPRAP